MMANPGRHFASAWSDAGCKLEPAERDANIVVFTSATPIGIWTALAMEIT